MTTFCFKFLCIVVLVHIPFASSDCKININKDVPLEMPLLLKPNEVLATYHLPYDNLGQIKFHPNEKIKFACPKAKVLLQNHTTNAEVITGSCYKGKSFLVNGKHYDINGIKCSRYPFHEARYTKNTCLGKYKEIEIGFRLENSFVSHILICFDDIHKTTKYTTMNLSTAIGGRQIKIPRPTFLAGNFFKSLNVSINTLYKRKKQQQIINNLVGLPKNSQKYIQNNGNFFMARGHLTPKGDFIYGAVQRSTFYFVNAVPQWHTLNSKNWNKLEQNTQDLADQSDVDLKIYSGSEGVMSLPHEDTNKNVSIYLFHNNKLNAVPVPLFTWKVVINPKSEKATAFVGVNNPFEIIKSPCKSICDEISWITIKHVNAEQGYVYCCSVQDLRDKFDSIPEFTVKGLLK